MENQVISDILVAAFEGGSTYWLDKVEIIPPTPGTAQFASDVPGLGGLLDLHFEGQVRRLDRAMMEKGIEGAAKLRGLTVERFYDDHDAVEADVALQLAVLGEVVYG